MSRGVVDVESLSRYHDAFLNFDVGRGYDCCRVMEILKMEKYAHTYAKDYWHRSLDRRRENCIVHRGIYQTTSWLQTNYQTPFK